MATASDPKVTVSAVAADHGAKGDRDKAKGEHKDAKADAKNKDDKHNKDAKAHDGDKEHATAEDSHKPKGH